MNTIKTAGQLVKGDVVATRDGAALTVETVETRGGFVHVTFERGTWIIQPGPARVRPSSRVDVVVADAN